MSKEKHWSRPVRLLGRFLRSFWQGLVVAALALALGVAAYLSPGLVEADVKLDEGNVYVIKRDTELVGTLNSQIKQLSSATQVGDSRAQVLQSGDKVLLWLTQSSSLVAYNAARNITGSTKALPANANVQLVGDQLLVTAAESGATWAGPVDQLMELDFEKSKPDLEVGDGGVATLTTEGKVIGLDVVESELVRMTDQGTQRTRLPFTLEPDSSVSLSAVGDKAVVLDRTAERIWVEGMSETMPVSDATGAKLMDPAPSALRGEGGIKAIYANRAGLNAVTSNGQESLSGRIDLNPVTPIQVGNCVYGAGVSGSEGVFVRRCVGDSEATRTPIEEITSEGDSLVFQANRGVVTLNDQSNGTVWMVDKDMFIIRPSDWDGVKPIKEDQPNNETGSEVETTPERSDENRAPIANDDPDLGARAGTSTVLNVLDNDSDPDGDVLTITSATKLDGATLQPTRGGTGLQITISPDVKASEYTFDYSINDGRGGSDTATATVKVSPSDITASNSAPEKSKKPGGHKAIDVRTGTKLSTRVLLDWRDPEGDPIFLKNAWLEAGSDDILTFTPDGTIEYIDVGLKLGPKVINVTVSDGRAETTDELQLNIVEDPVAPVAYGDYVTAKAGAPVNIEPLANDRYNQATLTDAVLSEDCQGCTLSVNHGEKTVTFSANATGTYYVLYTIVDGKPATGVIRIDVQGEATKQLPVAAADVALLPLGGTVVLDPLLNDTDPNGDVLVVQTYDAPASLEVVMERRHRMTIRARGTLDAPVTFTYWISNGESPVEGKITVVPTDTGSGTPIPVNDQVVVRAGTTATVTPLTNDTSPVGLELSLGELGTNPFGDRAWIDGDRVRITVPAGTPAGVSTIGYSVVDSRGGVAPGTITVEVVSEDAPNVAPAPEPVVERVLAGTETRIAIPLNGIDANGDAVRLIGLATGPQLGRVTSVGEEYLTYQAFEGARGTDTFKYEVVDAKGESAVGEVRVGVAPLSKDNTKPVAIQDEITVRPGREVRMAAISNDFDADGDGIGYTPDAPIEMDNDIDAKVDGREISFTAPQEPGTYSGVYSIQDSRGEQSYGSLLINVVDNAPNVPPVARDDSVSIEGIVDQRIVDVGVLDNDYDPDGARDDLRIELADGSDQGESGPRVNDEGTRISVPVKADLQQIGYVLIDGDGGRTNGLVIVPGTNNLIPTLKENIELQAEAGQPLVVDVNSLVRGTEGRQVRLTTADHIWSPNAESVAAGEGKISYRADASFSGPASLVFEVEDVVSGPNDKTGKRAVISIPIEVAPASTGSGENGENINQIPQLRVQNPRLEVGAGEGERSLNLLSLFDDPDGDQNSMAIKGQLREVGGDGAITWSTSGEMLTASAPEGTQPGAYKELAGVVMDGREGETDFRVRIEVTASTRPTVTVKDDVIDNAKAGQRYVINVTSNDVSHLLNDKSISLVSVRATSDGGSAEIVDAARGEVAVTLEAGRHGPFTATYTVVDATMDPNRHVSGVITAQVIDVPGTPSTPYFSSDEIRDGQVTVLYRSTGDGGSPITSATATASSPGLPDRTGTCAANSCTVTGLANGSPWRISVVETNQVGSSQPSGLSAARTPDAVPDPPTQPTVAYEDGKLTASWSHDKAYSSSNGGSSIVGYDLELLTSGGAPIKQSLSASAKSYTWSNLTNGQNYQFRVSARNSSGLVSAPSKESSPQYPSGIPTGSANPVARPINDDIGGAFDVSFTTTGVNNRGDRVSKWIVTPITQSGGGSAQAVEVADTGETSYTVRIRGMGTEPTKFKVQAVNRGPGIGEVGSTSDFLVALPQPQIKSATATATDGGARLKIETNMPAGTEIRYYYSLDGGSMRQFDGETITGLTNGETYSIRLQIRVDSLTSASHSVADVQPKAAQAPAPRLAKRELQLPNRVRVTFDNGSRALGGWKLSEYKICGPGGACASGDSLTLDAGQSSRVTWQAGGQSGSWNESLAGIRQPTFNDSGLEFSYPYVSNGSCTMALSGPSGGTRSVTVSDSNGELSYRGQVPQVPVANPDPGQALEEVANSVKLSCTAHGTSTNVTLTR